MTLLGRYRIGQFGSGGPPPPAGDYLITEDGNPIVTDDGDYIGIEGAAPFSPLSLSPKVYVIDPAGAFGASIPSVDNIGSLGGTFSLPYFQPTVGDDFGLHSSISFTEDPASYLDANFTYGNALGTGDFTIQIIAEMRSLHADNPGAPYYNRSFLGDNSDGDFYVNVTDAGVAAGYLSGGYVNTTPVLILIDVKYCIQITYQSGALTCNVRGVGSSLLAASLPGAAALSRNIQMSNNYGGGYINGNIAQLFMKDSALTTLELDAMYLDAKTNFGAT